MKPKINAFMKLRFHEEAKNPQSINFNGIFIDKYFILCDFVCYCLMCYILNFPYSEKNEDVMYDKNSCFEKLQ